MRDRSGLYRSERRLLMRGGLWNALGWSLSVLVGPPVMVAIVRTMSHAQYGVLAIGGAIIGPAAAVATLGLGPSLTQIATTEAVRSGEAGLAAALRTGGRVTMRAMPYVVLACAALVGVIAVVPQTRPATFVVLVMLPTIIVAPFSSLSDGFIRATGSAAWLGIASSAGTMTAAAATAFVLAFTTPTATPVALTRVVAPVVTAALMGWAVLRWWRQSAARRISDDAHDVDRKRFRSFSIAMLLNSLSWLLISQFDVLFLGADRGKVAAGLYTPASRVADIAIGVAAMVGTLLLPALTTALQAGERDKAVDLYHWASRWSLVATAPFMSVMLVVPGAAMHALFGTGFGGVSTALRLFGVAVLLHVGFGYNGFLLEAHGVPKMAAVRSGAGVLTTVVLCAVLIPLFGFTGAAVATAGAVGVVNVFSSTALLTRFGIGPWDVDFGLALFGFGLALPIAWAIQSQLSGDIVRCLLVAIVVTALTFAASRAHVLRGRRGPNARPAPGDNPLPTRSTH